ncbi:MAG: UDP-glucose 4-epimerase family protein [Gemmatimonas sp.]
MTESEMEAAHMATSQGSERVLVTGASGFVGQTLVDTLLREGTSVVAAYRRERDPRPGVHAVNIGDMDANTNWAPALTGVDAVVHLAARVHVMNETAANPIDAFRRVNVEGTRNLALQARASGVRRFVFVSSIKVNGESGSFTDTDAPNPVDPYGISKREAEEALWEVARTTGLEVVVIRPPLVYGPGVKANFQALVRLAQRGIPLPFGAIDNRRSFVAVDNLVSLISCCLRHPQAAGETFLVSDGHDLSTAQLLRAMAAAANKPITLIPVPPLLLRAGLTLVGKGAMADRLLDSLTVNISNAQRKLGWVPPVGVDDALRRTLQNDGLQL